MGAFKFRGAFNALSQFDARAAARRRRRLLVGQPRAGDRAGGAPARHAGGDRHAARRAGRQGRGDARATAARSSSTTATREDREAIGRRLADERGMTLIPPYDHPDVIAGQGTAAKELIEEVGPARRAVRLPRRRRPARRLRAGGARARAGVQGLSASSPRPATTASSRCAAARSSTSTCRRRSPTARRRSARRATRFRSSAATSSDIVTASDAELVDGDALLRRADEDGRRADRLPRLRGRARA